MTSEFFKCRFNGTLDSMEKGFLNEGLNKDPRIRNFDGN